MKLSVIIPTYNHEPYIAKAINCVLNQRTNFNFEILVGEDESSDQTRNICMEYAMKYPDIIKLFLNDRSKVIYILGKPTGRWNLINLHEQSTGEYIALCEGDDYWTDPLKLQKQIDFLEAQKDCSACFHPVFWIEDGRFHKEKQRKLYNKKFFTAEDLFANDNFIRTCSVVYRNHFQGKFPDWFQDIPYGDIAIHILNARQGKIGFIDEYMAVYRVHKEGIYSGENKILNWMKSIQTFEIIAKSIGFERSPSFHKGIARVYNAIAGEANRNAKYHFTKS
jgi:glycosyltransferase involved in cell wall biosynthesis